MLKDIRIRNFKSILDASISLGRINVFIGENGVGKSNILEALMFASLAETYETIDADILYTNGIRVSKPSLILSSFKGKKQTDTVEINLKFTDVDINCKLKPEKLDNIFSKWTKRIPIEASITISANYDNKDFDNILIDAFQKANHSGTELNQENLDVAEKLLSKIKTSVEYRDKFISAMKESLIKNQNKLRDLNITYKDSQAYHDLSNFIIYTLNTEALRGIPEFQKSKKGIYGETLDIIINELNQEELAELKNYLYAISWIDDFFIDSKDELKQSGYKLNYSKSLLYFKDKFMMKKNNVFSSENSNEGILHLLFYFSNIISSKMPRLFAIDNIETSLNPHLCQHIMFEICGLAKKHEKQILLTTHNPAILDGLDLFDDDVRLFEVFRTDYGDTRARRIQIKPTVKDQNYKLSELWSNGFLGAISENF